MRAFVASLLFLNSVAFAQDPLRHAQDDLIGSLRAELQAARVELDELRHLGPATTTTGSLGVDFTNQYLFRGIPQEDQGVIAQPHVELGFRLHDDPGPLRSVDLTLGIWNSLHEGPTRAAGSIWYESDVYAGLAAGIDDRFRAEARYTAIHSPNGRFETVQEITLLTAFDDRDLLLPHGLQPSVLVSFELAGQADAGRHRGIVAEIGLRPPFPLGAVGSCECELLVPVKVGLSVADYYESPTGGADEWFGYLDAGLAVAAALPFVPAPRSPWRTELGLHYVLLGDTNKQRNGGDSDELVVSLGVSTTF